MCWFSIHCSTVNSPLTLTESSVSQYDRVQYVQYNVMITRKSKIISVATFYYRDFTRANLNQESICITVHSKVLENTIDRAASEAGIYELFMGILSINFIMSRLPQDETGTLKSPGHVEIKLVRWNFVL